MLLRVGFEMAFSFPQPTAMVLMLHVHPSRTAMIRSTEQLEVERVLGVRRRLADRALTSLHFRLRMERVCGMQLVHCRQRWSRSSELT